MQSLLAALVSLLAAAALYWLFYWRPRRHLCLLARQIPGPPTYPLLGNALVFAGGKITETLNIFLKLFEDFGPVVRLWFGDQLVVLLSHPDDIQQVLGNTKIRNRDYLVSKAAATFFGNGLLSNRDDVWKVHRKLITPTFHFKILESYVEVFGRKAEVLIGRLDKMADGRSFDIYNYLCLCTLDAICETALGTPCDIQTTGIGDMEQLLYDITGLMHNRFFKPWLLIDWLYWRTSDGRKAKLLKKRMNCLTAQVISHKLQAYRSGVRSSGTTLTSGKTITAFLDMLIEASETQGSLLTAAEMEDEVATLSGAGLETSSTAMSFLLLLVAIHPDVQNQVAEELDGIFGGAPLRMPCSEDLARMSVMDRVIKETLRHNPIATTLSREISEDVHLPSGFTLPKGCSTMVMSYAVHRREEFYKDPHRFWPDRWLPENNPPRHPYAYLPFSAGQRNCVGQKYAMLQMKTILATLLRRYKVTTDYKMADMDKLELSTTLKLGTGKHLIQLEHRDIYIQRGASAW